MRALSPMARRSLHIPSDCFMKWYPQTCTDMRGYQCFVFQLTHVSITVSKVSTPILRENSYGVNLAGVVPLNYRIKLPRNLILKWGRPSPYTSLALDDVHILSLGYHNNSRRTNQIAGCLNIRTTRSRTLMSIGQVYWDKGINAVSRLGFRNP